MATYMIDYENVKTGGLNGISRLTESDKVIIFYSENANRLTFDLHRRLMESQASIEYREVTVGGHNALDFQLVTYLGYLIAHDKCGQYLIISNDRGFEHVVNFWRKDGLEIGLLPYLKDPAYALQKVARLKEECPCEESSPISEQTEPEVTDEPEIVFEKEAEDEPEIEVEFYSVEEESPAEEPAAEVPASVQEDLFAEEPALEAKAAPAEEPAPEAKPKQTKRSSRKKAQLKEEFSAEKPQKNSKSAEKPARLLPTMDELRALIGELVEDDLELRFVSTAIGRYKTKLGLNNALVKNFGNQKASDIYQKVKQFAK